MTLQQYLENVNILYKTGNAREHAYRGDLATLLKSILPDVLITNEPARVECGAPDYVLTRKDVPVGYIEAKDIGVDLGSKTLKEQFDRYRAGLSNLIFTDYLEFHFYKEGEFTTKIAIAKIEGGNIVALPENFATFTSLIQNFASTVSQTIKSPTKLAQMMAGKAKLMADVIERSLDHDNANDTRSQLKAQMLSFKQMLIHDIDNKAFSDIYAQTIAYGMFAARYHDPTLPTFSRMEAAQLIPKSNPFLRKLFQDIAGFDLDSRLVWIVDELVHIFLASDVAQIMKNFGRSTRQEDPVVHFYETFLGEYNPALRKARGVWYTPQPVVNFIVRAVDDILKTEFNLPQGLADTSKVKVKKKSFTQSGSGASSKIKEVETFEEVHKVQILDPATGTGTFLAEVVKHIHKKFEGQQGIWSQYVRKDLIPRLNGFELLMASYAMAHLKMDMLLTETGYKPTDDQRFKIFLTNSLEEAHPDTQTLFSSWLSDEADQANAIKRDAPVMVVIGNPPYSVSSSNKGSWIEKLTADYKKDLNERNIQPLSDDYIKFIRFGQHLIDNNIEGILAYISNNSFIDGIIHRQMRKSLLDSFNKIYIIDLHGNSKKKDVAIDGSADQNVFDIMQGVSINLFVKTNSNSNENSLQIISIKGKRDKKYKFLNDNTIGSISWNYVKPKFPNYLFTQQDQRNEVDYDTKFFGVNNIFLNGSNGVQTKRDDLFIDFQSEELGPRISNLLNGHLSTDFRKDFNIQDSSSYPLLRRISQSSFDQKYISKILYRPLDTRSIYYDKNLIGRPFYKVMQNIWKSKSNFCLIVGRQGQAVGGKSWNLISICNTLLDTNLFYRGGNMAYPLYLNADVKNEIKHQHSLDGNPRRVPNLNMEIVDKIAEDLGMYFQDEEPDYTTTVETNQFYPITILDYIYAVLHSPTYRETYKEFLKIDFPRVPYPKDKKTFWDLVELGGDLRQIHLMESPVVEEYITQFPEDGDNIVKKPIHKNGNVYINETQYFANVPDVAWNFYIGGYQPAQKWLKDRKDRELGYEDILHYQKIIVALTETDRIMKEIDKIDIVGAVSTDL